MNFRKFYVFILVVCFVFSISISITNTQNERVLFNTEGLNNDTFIPKEIGFIKFPIFTTPALVFQGMKLNITTSLADNVSITDIHLENNDFSYNLTSPIITSMNVYGYTIIHCIIPYNANPGLYSLYLNTSQETDYTYHSVNIYDTIPESFSLVHITDSHIGSRSYNTTRDLKSAVKIMNHINPSLIIHTGDLIDGGAGSSNETLINERYKEALTILSDLNSPIFVVNGNHETYAGKISWDKFMGSISQTSFDFGPIHITVTNSIWPRNLTWIKEDVLANNDKTTILGYHWDYGDELDPVGANIHILGDEHRSYVEDKGLYTRIVTGKTYYGNINELGVIRELKFNMGNLVDNILWEITDLPPEFSTTTIQYSTIQTTSESSITSTTTTESVNTSQTSISSQSSTSSESSMSDSNTTEEKNPNTTGSEYLFSVIPIPILFIFHLKKKRSS